MQSDSIAKRIMKTCPNTEIVFSSKHLKCCGKNLDMFLIFAQNEAVLTGTHNLCFGAKIRKIDIPLHTPVVLYKSGVQWGYTLHGHVFLMGI